MQALIDFIIRNLLALWPLVTVDEWKAAMMVRNGRIHRPLSAGLHWRWPELQGEHRKTREAEILKALAGVADSFGVEIVRVHLVACVVARQHRHFVDGSLSR